MLAIYYSPLLTCSFDTDAATITSTQKVVLCIRTHFCHLPPGCWETIFIAALFSLFSLCTCVQGSKSWRLSLAIFFPASWQHEKQTGIYSKHSEYCLAPRSKNSCQSQRSVTVSRTLELLSVHQSGPHTVQRQSLKQFESHYSSENIQMHNQLLASWFLNLLGF